MGRDRSKSRGENSLFRPKLNGAAVLAEVGRRAGPAPMPSFASTFLDRLAVPADLVQTIRQIGEHKGRQDLYRVHAPEKLENLRQVAMIQSVESSNRIEGLVAANGRVEALVRGT